MKRLICAIALAATFGCVSSAGAQTYPSRPITMIVPFAAGGPTDAIGAHRGRAHAGVARPDPSSSRTSTGAAGTIGVGRAARAAPDGYTLSIGHLGTHVINGAIYSLPYDLLKDFEPVALLPSNPLLVLARRRCRRRI